MRDIVPRLTLLAAAAFTIAAATSGCSTQTVSPPRGPLEVRSSTIEICYPASSLPGLIGAGLLIATNPVTVESVTLTDPVGVTNPNSYLVTNAGGKGIGSARDPLPADVEADFGVARWESKREAAGATIEPGDPGQQLILKVAGTAGTASGILVRYTSNGFSYDLQIPQRTKIQEPTCAST